MKKLLLLLTLLCASFGMVKASEVEIGDPEASTTTTSTYIPYNTLFNYGWSQEIYTADEIGTSGTINSITLYLYHTSGSSATPTSISIYMKEVDRAEFSSTTDWESMSDDDMVYSGTLTVNHTSPAQAYTFELDEPFSYSGSDNLMIAFANNTGNYKSYLTSLVFDDADNADCSIYAYRDASAYDISNPGTASGLLKKKHVIVLDITAGGSGSIPCEKPSGITASDLAARAAVLTWADGSGVYNVEYKKASDEEWTPLLSETTMLTTNLSNLDPNTDYQARVQSVCAGNVDHPTSSWKTVSFKTLIGIPYSENFNASSSIPTGWTQKSGLLTDILSGSSFSTGSGWSVSTTTCANFTSNHLYQNVYGSSKKHWIMLPRIPMEDNTQLTFDLAITRSGCAEKTPGAQDDDKFVVLISTDSLATWTILRQWDNAGSEYVFDNISNTGEEVAIDLSAYAGQNAHIALYAESTSGPTTGAGDNYFHIDNILIDYIPRCLKPSDLKVENITTSQAELSWTANSSESEWILQYKKSSENAWQSLNVTANPYTLDNLDAYTNYDFRVAASCDQIDEFGTSKFSSVVSFKTNAAAPFAEAFTSLPADWKRYSVLYSDIASGEDTLTNHPVTSGWTVSTGNGVYGVNHLKLNVYGENVKNWIVSPLIEMNQAEMQLTFDLALTKSSGTLEAPDAGQQGDDKFSVLVTTDNGETWEELYVRDNVTSADPYDQISCTADGQTVKIDLSAYAESTIAIAFYGESTEAGGDNYLHIRNFDIDTIPSCEKPMGLAVSSVSSSAATFGWDEVEDATWAYGIVANPADNFVPTDADFTGSTQNYIVTIDTLTENTPYLFFVRRACGGSNSEPISRLFLTEQTPINLPYEDGFEDGQNWVLINGDLTNQWVLGEAVNNGGTHSLYISNDNGTSNAYTNNAAGTVYATKTFNFDEAGTYAVSFDWRANGESTWDILCVALVPDGTQVEASSTAGQWTALPTGWTALHEGVKLNLQSSWQHSSYELNIENEGIYKIVMVWRNDGSGGTNPPAAVDNFSIVRLLCPAPTELSEVAETATINSVQLDWVPGSETNWFIQYKKAAAEEWTLFAGDVTTPPFTLTGLEASSTYNVRVAAWCDPTDSLSASDWSSAITVATACDVISEFPYSENFDGIEGVTSGNVLPVCWDYINTVTGSTSYDYYPTVYKGSSYANSGTNSLKLLSYYNYEGEMYAILPEMEGLSALRMKFNARKYSTSTSYTYYDATFVVGILNSAADTANFVAIDTITPSSTTYAPFEVKFNTYEGTGKHIAIKMVSPDYYDYDYNGVYIDDIVIDSIPDCFEPTAVKVVKVDATSMKFTYTAREEGDSLSYAVVLKGAEPTEFVGVAADTVLVEGLAAGTEYELYLRTECANSHSLALYAAFQTKQLPIDLGDGFADDFEGANLWTLENGTLTNAWVLGTAAHNGEGSTKALYISNDGGAHNAYTITTAAVVYAMKPFNIAGGSYTFQYDWMAYGESSADYLRVALVPASIELTAGTALPTGVTATALPEGCIAIDGGSKQNLSSAWATYTSEEIAVPAGTYNVVFMWRNDGSVGTQTPAAVDNFSITKVLCGKPTGLKIEKANITATSAIIEWTADEGQTEWILAMDTIASFNKDSDAIQTIVSANPYTVENLLPEHTYYVYVRANCGENGFSAWSARASFKTAKSCQKPDGLEVASITDSSAVVTWNTYGQNDFILTYGIGNAYADTVEVVGGTYTITGLDENTSYKVKVAAACDATQWTSAKTFKTACSAIAAVVENFDGITGSTSSHVLPDCWSYLNEGTSTSYNYYPTVYAGASYANSGSNSLKFYSYTGHVDQYAILPAVEGLNGMRMKFNARKNSTSYAANIVVGVMTDPADAATFVVIDTVKPAGTVYEPFMVSFGEYAGEGMYAAFKMPVPASSYAGFYIDDIAMEAIPSCLEPTALAVSDIATTSATVDWTSTASQWQILLNNDTAHLIDVAAKPFVLNELTPATTYTFAVRAICAEGDTSAWSKATKFVTECEIISLADSDYVQDFESFEGTAYNVAGVTPICWEVGGTSTYTPHVVVSSGSYAWVHSGTKSLNLCASANSYAYAILPNFAQPINKMQIEFWYRMESTSSGTLYLGYVAGDSLAILKSFENTQTVTSTGELRLDTVPAAAENLAIIWQHTGSSFYSCTIDDVVVSLIPSCPKPTGLHTVMVGDTLATLAWDNEEDVAWEYGLVLDTAANFVPADADFTGVTFVNEVTIGTLAPQTAYLFFMRKVCDYEKSEIIYKSFSTVMTATALPYDDDFENGNSWLLVNGAMTNAWAFGSAATESGNALYISNDGGTTYAYTITDATMVYAVKAFNFDKAGRYTVSYDWRANGESNYDYLRVAIVPASVELTAATSVPSGFSTTGLPTGWKAADGGSKLNLNNAWQSKSVVVEDIVPGYYQLVFAWRNDNSTGTQNPAAVDNIHIQHLDYPTAIGNIEGEGAQAVKFLHNDQVYILINGVVYNITGQKVEVK